MVLGIILMLCKSLSAQQSISGQVSDKSNVSIPGVSVAVKGTTKGVMTNADGRFSIAAKVGEILVFSSIGFENQGILIKSPNPLTVTLETKSQDLEQVVVIGYGTQKKANVTSAMTTFNAEGVDERPVTRVDQALVGQMAGVTIKQTTGVPGKAFSVQIRGVGSITAGSEPLYVIDGFPLTPTKPNESGNYAGGNPLDNINPNDIESIQVLKDAASAAIYGSRAANGVVLITTKRGQAGKPKITFNTYAGMSQANRKLDMLNAEEWIDRATEMINAQWVASAPGRNANQTNVERRNILGLAQGTYNTSYMYDDRWFQEGHPGLYFIDWQDEAFRKGLVQNYQVTSSGATDFVNYYVSGNYSNQEGMIIGMDYKAYSARANVEVSPNKKLKFGLNLAPTYSIGNDPGIEGKDNIIHQIASMSPVQQDEAVNVNTFGFIQYPWSTSTNSPLAKLKYQIGQTKKFRTLGTLFGQYKILDNLTLRSTLNLDNTDNRDKRFVPYTITGTLANRTASPNQGTSGANNSYRRQTFVNENTLTYSKVFSDAHDFSILLGQAYNTDKLETTSLSSTGGFTNSSITTLNAAVATVGSSTETKNVMLSYFSRVQYGYKNKYLLSASIRRDGSSRFGANTKWGWFPSLSAGWRVVEENFMKSSNIISDLKLRASYGESGNYNIGDYSSIALLGGYNYTFNNALATGQAPGNIVNPDLTWEKSKTYDFGLDFGILNNRLTGSFDIYKRVSSDLLLNVPSLQITGFSSYLDNAGEVVSKGWELELTSRNIVRKDFQWNTSFNLAHNTNKVTALSGGQTQIFIPSSFDISHSVLRIGEPLYSIFVVRQDGILTQQDIDKGAALYGSQKVGDPKYVDAYPDGVIDEKDRVIVGHPNPDYTWGITNTFKYKGFDLSLLIQGQNGGSIYSLLGRALGRTGQGASDNALGFYRDRWRSASNPGAGIVGKAYSTFGRIKNTDWLYSSDYWRVRNITLGYNFDKFLKNQKIIQGARIYLTAENYFGHDKYKGGFNPEATNTNLSGSTVFPEAGDYGGLPLAKSLIFGLNFTF